MRTAHHGTTSLNHADRTVGDTQPPRRRRGGVLLLGAVLGLTVAIGWWLSGPNTAVHEGATQAPTSASHTPAPSLDRRATTSDVTWHDFAGLSLPVSGDDGPRCLSDGRAACFTHTDDGAALAAVHLLVRTFPFAGSAVFAPTIAEQVVGSDAEALARLTEQAYTTLAASAGLEDGEPIRSEGGWVAGYRLDPPPQRADVATRGVPDGDLRAVRVLIRQSGSDGADGFTEYAVRLVWSDGDWALVAPAWGDWRSAARAMSTADPAQYASYDTIGRP